VEHATISNTVRNNKIKPVSFDFISLKCELNTAFIICLVRQKNEKLSFSSCKVTNKILTLQKKYIFLILNIINYGIY